jgi:glycine cleavage system regulatory protein
MIPRTWRNGRRAGLLALLCVACHDVGHVYRLTTALNQEFAETRMGVSLTDQIILTVTVADSVLVTASCQAQVGIAMRIGRFLREYDTDIASLQVVNVAFTPGRKDASATVRARLPIRFSPARIRAGLSASDSTDAVGSCKAYEDLGGV